MLCNKSFHVKSYQADLQLIITVTARLVSSPHETLLGKNNKIFRYFLLSPYHITKLQPSDKEYQHKYAVKISKPLIKLIEIQVFLFVCLFVFSLYRAVQKDPKRGCKIVRALVRTVSCKPSTQEKFDLLAKYWPNDRHEQAARFGHWIMLLRLAHFKRDFNLSNISILRFELTQLKLFFWPTTFIRSSTHWPNESLLRYAKRALVRLGLAKICLYRPHQNADFIWQNIDQFLLCIEGLHDVVRNLYAHDYALSPGFLFVLLGT